MPTIGSAAEVVRRSCDALQTIGARVRRAAEASPDQPELWLRVRDIEGLALRLLAAEQFQWDPHFALGQVTGQDVGVLDELADDRSIADGAERGAIKSLRALLDVGNSIR